MGVSYSEQIAAAVKFELNKTMVEHVVEMVVHKV